MGLDLEYIRCPEHLLTRALADVDVARKLVYGPSSLALLGPGETMERELVDRREGRIFRQIAGGELSISDDQTTWIGRALVGDGWLHMGVVMNAYGSPRFLDVRQVAELVAPFTAFAPERIDEDCRHAYSTLREFYLAAARERQVVIIVPE